MLCKKIQRSEGTKELKGIQKSPVKEQRKLKTTIENYRIAEYISVVKIRKSIKVPCS